MKFHPCKVRCLGTLPQQTLVPGPEVHTGSSSALREDSSLALHCQMSGEVSSSPSSTVMMKEILCVLAREAGAGGIGLEWRPFYRTGGRSPCGLWEALSTKSFGGRKYGFHIFPGREKSTDLATGTWKSYILVPVISQLAGQLEHLTSRHGSQFPHL